MSVLREVELEQQLSVTYRLDGGSIQAYVLGRSGVDFSDEDLVIAREIQRLIIGVDRQLTVVRRLTQAAETSYTDADLTSRELAVLGLVAAGHSTRAVAHRLCCSPRTVNKHLEHTYRKLGVSDRINAIRTARLWGLVAAPSEASTGAGS